MALNTFLLHPAGFQYLFVIMTLISSSPEFVGYLSKHRLHGKFFKVVLSNLQLILRHYCRKPMTSCKTSFDLQGVTFFAVTSSNKVNLGES